MTGERLLAHRRPAAGLEVYFLRFKKGLGSPNAASTFGYSGAKVAGPTMFGRRSDDTLVVAPAIFGRWSDDRVADPP